MKKSELIIGSLYVLFGIACLAAAILTETKLDGILWGFAGAGIVPGIVTVSQYFYWNAPGNKARYADRLAQKEIEMHDELKTRIRDKAGRYTFVLGLMVTCAAMLVFSILGALEIIEHTRMLVLYLFGFLLFQEFAGIFIFNKLMKQY